MEVVMACKCGDVYREQLTRLGVASAAELSWIKKHFGQDRVKGHGPVRNRAKRQQMIAPRAAGRAGGRAR